MVHPKVRKGKCKAGAPLVLVVADMQPIVVMYAGIDLATVVLSEVCALSDCM